MQQSLKLPETKVHVIRSQRETAADFFSTFFFPFKVLASSFEFKAALIKIFALIKDEMSVCYVEGVAFSDENAHNHHLTAILSANLFSDKQH